MEIRPEVKAAAQWWADQLRSIPSHQSGDPAMNAVMLAYSRTKTAVPEQDVLRFQEALERAIENKIKNAAWDIDNPLFGGVLRVIATDYGPDPVLYTALTLAGIRRPSSALPIKTVMWINPGHVSVVSGAGGASVDIYTGEVTQ